MLLPNSDDRVAPEWVGKEPEIRAQLDRVVSSSVFRTSKRYPALLRHVVEHALDGRVADLKERTLGTVVFGRPADYDTNADPIVRTSAGEVRRRIAQYYHEEGRETEIRIDLPVGSYVPVFHFPQEPVAMAGSDTGIFEPSQRVRPRFILATVALASLVVVSLVVWRLRPGPAPFEQFWRPLLESESTVSLCVAAASPEAAPMTGSRLVAWGDVKATAKLAGLLEANRQPYQIRRDDQTTMEDLRRAPAILVGAFNDIWTLRVMEGLRFSFRKEGSLYWIQDSRNPSSRDWSVDRSRMDSAGRPLRDRDYAVISRVLNARTGKPVIAVAGTLSIGTEMAGECVTSRTFLASLARLAPADWQRRNVQVVILTEVIDGHAGPPRIVATHFW